jgi:hypothetical protein
MSPSASEHVGTHALPTLHLVSAGVSGCCHLFSDIWIATPGPGVCDLAPHVLLPHPPTISGNATATARTTRIFVFISVVPSQGLRNRTAPETPPPAQQAHFRGSDTVMRSTETPKYQSAHPGLLRRPIARPYLILRVHTTFCFCYRARPNPTL